MNLENRMDITLFDIYADLHVHVCEQKRGQDMLIFLENAEDFFFLPGQTKEGNETKHPPSTLQYKQKQKGGGWKKS